MFTYYKTYKELGKNFNTNGHDYVDLGLPSDTLWATCNVGASKPSDYGLFFQWGDTSGYTADQVGKDKQFSDDHYKWYLSKSGSFVNPTYEYKKYTTAGATLELADDAANVNMGGSWHMPTPAQIQELINETTNTWATQDGVNGRLFTSKSDTSKSIFIPAPGYALNSHIQYSGSWSYIWSSMLDTDSKDFVPVLESYVGTVNIARVSRYLGSSVRGVIG